MSASGVSLRSYIVLNDAFFYIFVELTVLAEFLFLKG